jgi:predicted metal-dependent phosphotriesterase family hydrolase
MTTSINTTAAYVALDTFAGKIDGARAALVKALGKAGIATLEDARPVAMQWVSARTKCRIVNGAGKATGRMVLDATHPKYEAAKKSLQRVMDAFAPKAKSGTSTANKSDPIKLLVTRYQALTKAEQKRFLASI